MNTSESNASNNLRKDSVAKMTSINDRSRKDNGCGDAPDNGKLKECEKKMDRAMKQISRNDDESTIRILPGDEVEPVLDKNECLVEFRAVTSYSSLPPVIKPLHMMFGESNWIPMEMAFNKNKSHYFLRILFIAKHTDCFQFKFCRKIDRHSINYEQLPSSDILANRMISLTKRKNHSTISQNVCCFDENYGDWMKNSCNGMEKFLPELYKIAEFENSKNNADLLRDLLTWFDTMSTGWTVQSYVHCPNDKIEAIILSWLRKVSKSFNEGSINRLQRIMLALYLCIAFHKHGVECLSIEMYKILIEMLSVHQLTKRDCEVIYEKCTSAFAHVQRSGVKLPFVREVMHWLYKELEKYSINNWIFSLPLYWLFVHGEVRVKVVEEDRSKEPLLRRASLPAANTINWKYIRSDPANHKGTSYRRTNYIDMADTIVKMAEFHPWIVKTYLSMLEVSEITILVMQGGKVINLFQVDDMVMIFLKSRERYKSDEKQADAFKEYFQTRLAIAISLASQSGAQCSTADSNVECCLAILQHINDFAKPQGRQNCSPRQLRWLIDAILLRTLHWIGALQMNPDDENQFQKSFRDFLAYVTTGIYHRGITVKEIEFWGELLNISWNIDNLDKMWRETLLHEIQNAINNFAELNTKNEEFLKFFATALHDVTLHPDVEKFFSEKAYTITVSLMQKANNGGGIIQWIGKFFRGLPRSRIVSLFDKLFMREYDKIKQRSPSNLTRALTLTCNWMFSTQFFQLFGDESLADFSSESRNTVQLVMKSSQKVVQSILNGHIIVEHLRIISKNSDTFLLHCDLMDKSRSSVDPSSKSTVADQISINVSHLKTFEQTRALVKDFVLACNYVDYGDLPCPHAALDRTVRMDVSHLPIHDLMTFDESKKPGSAQFFGITQSHLVEFEQIRFLKKSRKLFRQRFTDAIHNALPSHREGLNLDDVMEIWASAKSDIFKLVVDIDSGEILISDVNDDFEILNGSKADIDYEVEWLYKFSSFKTDNEVDIKNKATRKLQIFNAFELQQTRQTMNVLLELREMLGLRGDFSKLLRQKDIIVNQSTTTLAQVPAELKMSAVTSITPKQIDILEKFMSSKNVISWLREKMEGMSEVKVMCDLAMISAGEDAVEVGRVSCLLSATMGFAPLIFCNDSKKQDEEATRSRKNTMPGLRELLNRCKEVWKNVEEDEKILDDWEEANHQLNWFKDVEKFYGSVEKSSLTKAQEINERGVYTISKRKGDHKLSLENSISLSLVRDKEEGSTQTLNLEVLRELQSKLMLIAGDAEKGQRDVNVFIDVLASIEKLAEVFVMLELSGCMLFSGWKAVIACKGSNDAGTNELTIQIIFSDEAPPLIGQGSHMDLDRITEILKESLDRWEEHVASKRTEHYYLNEFNINQIMYLCREISMFEATSEIPDQVKTLLSFVRQDFTEGDLRDSLETARRALDSDCVVESDTEESSEEDDDEEEQSDDEGAVYCSDACFADISISI